MSKVISIQTDNGTRVITLTHAPVNAVTLRVRQALIKALQDAAAAPAVARVVLCAKGQTFSAGTDIRDYKEAQAAPTLAQVCDAVEAMDKPVIAALHGTTLGAGVEIALAAHARIADPDARFGFSEANLGLIPCGGATQRLPRLVGAQAALDMMISGAPVTAASARSIGLLDALAEGDLMQDAIALAQAHDHAAPRRTRDLRDAFVPYDHFSQTIKQFKGVAQLMQGNAPRALVDLVETAALLPFDAGVQAEGDRFETLRCAAQSRALRHVYTATRRAARSGVAQGTKAQNVQQIGVVGASSAGCRIALRCLQAGFGVVLLDQNPKNRAAGAVFVEKQLAKAGQSDQLARLEQSADLADLGAADLIIEAVAEDRALKEGLFRVLGARAKAGAILATTSECFDLAVLAEMSGRPADVIALRISDRMPRAELCEVGSHKGSSDRAIATGCALVRKFKMPLVRGYGGRSSIAQALLQASVRASEYLMMRGVSVAQIDQAFTGFGFPSGVLQLVDTQGISAVARQLEVQGHSSGLLDALSDLGCLGVRSGTGFYDYSVTPPVANPQVARIAAELGQEADLSPRDFSVPRIQLRIWAAMLAEGARLVATGAAKRPLDVDIAAINGLGFPAWRGGPMKASDLEGLLLMQKALRSYADEDVVWTPDPLIAQALKTADGFDAMNGS